MSSTTYVIYSCTVPGDNLETTYGVIPEEYFRRGVLGDELPPGTEIKVHDYLELGKVLSKHPTLADGAEVKRKEDIESLSKRIGKAVELYIKFAFGAGKEEDEEH